ncbi:MAG: UPF0182 family protein, partial [Actinomycetes bacterium]
MTFQMPPDPEFSDRPQGVRPPRRPLSGRRRILLPVVLVLIAVAFAFVALSGVYTELLWFRSIGHPSVYVRIWVTKIGLFVAFGLLMALLVALSAWVAFRVRPVFRSVSAEQA